MAAKLVNKILQQLAEASKNDRLEYVLYSMRPSRRIRKALYRAGKYICIDTRDRRTLIIKSDRKGERLNDDA